MASHASEARGLEGDSSPDGHDPGDLLPVAVLGAGPAGLTAAYLLAKAGRPVVVFESDPELVGGISRTVKHQGYRFDIGGHRFFSKSKEVEQFWDEILPDDMLVRPRSSRIFYGGKFYSYPLKAMEAFLNLGPVESLRCVLSYAAARLRPVKDPKTFEDWVSNQFGRRLFGIFFKTYTEKVWGMSCREISADWAAQRIKGLSLGTALWKALFPPSGSNGGGSVVKTLIHSFRYPRHGPGMMWEACAKKVQALGGRVEMGRRVTACRWDGKSMTWTVETRTPDGVEHRMRAAEVISSAPLRELVTMLDPPVSPGAAAAAAGLRYRDFLTVVLILRERSTFSDNWIYIHEPGVKVGRVQNFKSWSPEMVPEDGMACYGLEYFCFEGDGMWNLSDGELEAMGREEIVILGLAEAGDIVGSHVVRQRKAYPVYDEGYAERVEVVRNEIEARFPTLHAVGRNGMHKYNNQDHSMMTAMLCVRNILAGSRLHDLWRVNEDAEYHEAGGRGESGLRAVPVRVGGGVDGSRA